MNLGSMPRGESFADAPVGATTVGVTAPANGAASGGPGGVKSTLGVGGVDHVLLLKDAVLHARRVIQRVRVQAIEQAIAAAQNRARLRVPRKAHARLKHLVVDVDGVGVVVAERAGLAVVANRVGLRRLRHQLHVVANAGVYGETLCKLPRIFRERA